jgi:uncharacterized protein YggE
MNPNSLEDLFGNTTIRIAVVGVLAILALFLFAETLAAVDGIGHTDTSNIASITVTGTGKASMAPNIANISFTVQENAPVVADAQNAATKRTNAALAALKKLGVADADVKTSGYNVNPQYEIKPCAPGVYCPQDTTKISGYQVSQSIEVKVRDTAKAGDVVAALGTVGVQNISGPNFMVDDTSAVEADARGKAISDARAKAQVLASQLGVHLGKVVGFSENGGGVPMPYFAQGKSAGMATDAAVAPTLPTGTNETNVTVSVTYEIR